MTSDIELIEKTGTGSLAAFDELMIRYERLVFSIAYGFTKNRDNAMDITQDTFLKAYQKLGTYNGKSSFKSWLSGITYHLGIDWLRKNKTCARFDTERAAHVLHPVPRSQEDEMATEEYRTLILRSLDQLNPQYRQIVVLRYFKNFSIKEIAEIQKCSEGVVKNSLYRSLKKMREHLSNTERGGLL
ncbi:RNA polymerase sigma factor [candidate division CSSED10-310 bacterium]|uniref:RNA polymerase sigma factor n=1 Tax=candidate division CSSED10-310 bacterium TaxID=2855610 RepID=A0ABV6YT78_UNCC1